MKTNQKEENKFSGINTKKIISQDTPLKMREASKEKIKTNITSAKSLKNNKKIILVSIIAIIVIAIFIIIIISAKITETSSQNSKKSIKYNSIKEIGFFRRNLKSCPSGQYLYLGYCKKCSAGTYSTYGRNRCLSCSSGTYSREGASSCTKCPAGTYSYASSSTCMQCPGGSYAKAGSSYCSSCLPGTYSGKASSECKKCKAGTYSSRGAAACSNCLAGTYSFEGSSNCNKCLPGTYSISGSSKCLICPKGTYSSYGYSTCRPCNPGYFSSQGSSSCSKCPIGYYSSSGASSCIKCPAGTYSSVPGSSICYKCCAGYFSKSGSSSCTKCPAGKTSKSGSSVCTNLCNPGYYYNWGNCYICPAGTYSAPDFSKCIDCQRGTSSSKGASTCKKCPGGTFSSSPRATLCEDCPAGTYSKTGAFSCIKCPEGKTSKKGSSQCVNIFQKVSKDIVSFYISSIIKNFESFCRNRGLDTAKIGAKILNMKIDSKGIYHAEFDCWQSIFGYNKLYDLVFDLGTSMDLNNEGMFTYNGQNYILWAWKGDYINLGAGAELGIYYGGSSRNSHWKVDKSLAMPMTLTLKHKTKGIIVDNWNNWGNNAWWITAFNPNYKNLKQKELTAIFTVKFKKDGMFNEFTNINRKGWEYDKINKIAKLIL